MRNNMTLALSAIALLALEAGSMAQPGSIKHDYLEANGIKLHYASSGSGKTILFLHGFPEFWYAWKGQVEEFGKSYRAVALDMRGYNLSDKPKAVEEYAVPKLVDDIKGVLEKLSPGKKAVLVAHDWGGVVAWAFAMTYPDMLEKLVIINAPHPALFGQQLAT